MRFCRTDGASRTARGARRIAAARGIPARHVAALPTASVLAVARPMTPRVRSRWLRHGNAARRIDMARFWLHCYQVFILAPIVTEVGDKTDDGVSADPLATREEALMSEHVLPAMAALAAAVILAGCAGTATRPDAEMDAAQAAITQAESAGARASSPTLLKDARDRVEEARVLIDQEEYAPAQRLLEQPTADARLAQEQARTAEAEQAVQELNETIEMLRDRMMEDQA